MKMIAKIKRIAESINMWRLAEVGGESDELLECAIRQFGDGMGITSIMSHPDGDTTEHGGEKACTV
jgi:hypothetical protein